jgi:uncharacterized phage protein (TIGR01671 family)
MNRFKFRVWDKTGGFFWGEGEGMDFKKIAFNFYDALFKEGELIFQQFTGLKDANEKEIFEGDILKYSSSEVINNNVTGYVIFDEGSFLNKISNADIRLCIGGEDSEVIGNIFDNPEFLK